MMHDDVLSRQDFEAFSDWVPWFIEPGSRVVLRPEVLVLREDFKRMFPVLAGLVGAARVTWVGIDDTSYLLFTWTDREGEICGWLNKMEDGAAYGCELIAEHVVLLENIGGIAESFNGPEGAFSANQNFMFTGSQCDKGIGWGDYYSRLCEEGGYTKIDYTSFVTFVYEANGAATLYDPVSKEVLLFSHDHAFDYVDTMENQPEYTFHRFKGISTYVDYVETLGEQWSDYVRRPV